MSIENLEAPMVGKVIKVLAKVGDKVSENDEICVIEAMKMENSIYSTVTGIIKEIKVTEGMVIKGGDTIAVIEY